MTDQSKESDDMTMLRSISAKERDVEAMIAEAHEEGESRIKEARQRAVRILEDARSRSIDKKRAMREEALKALHEEVRRAEHEYEQVLRSMTDKARARAPQAVERIIEAVLPR